MIQNAINFFSRRGAGLAGKNNDFSADLIIAPALFYLRAFRPDLRLCEKNIKRCYLLPCGCD